MSSAPLRREPDRASEQVNEALFGEPVRVFDRVTDREGQHWAFVQLGLDRYVGWIPAVGLTLHSAEPTHRVAVLRTFVYERPDLKSPPILVLSLNARMRLAETNGSYARVSGSGWVFARHVTPMTAYEWDFVKVAERFVGAPYRWGGRQSAGIDCSGLVQAALQATGIYPLRDSDLQEQTLGLAFQPGPDFSDLERGDLVFWRGHVGIMYSPDLILHASARDMHVEIEPLRQAIDRIRPIAGDVRSVRRFG